MPEIRINTAEIPDCYTERIAVAALGMLNRLKKQPGGCEALAARIAGEQVTKIGEDKKVKITLKAARVNARMTQEQAAKRIGVSRQTIIIWESGRRRAPFRQLLELCDAYGIKPEDIKPAAGGTQ